MSAPSIASYLARYPTASDWHKWVTEREEQRTGAVARQRPKLEAFLQGKVTVLEFKRWIDSESKQHNLWGFGGVSGQMFFNMVYNNNPTSESLGSELRAAMSLPPDQAGAVANVKRLVEFVRKENQRVKEPRLRASVGYIPFFLSYFWNIQEGARHPIYYPSAVETLYDLKLVNLYGIEEPDQRYDSYYTWMRRLKAEFGAAVNRQVSFTETENLLYWINQETEEQPESAPSEQSDVAETLTEEVQGTEHTEIQWKLAKIGKLRGYQVHVANNDAGRSWKGEKLGDVGGDHLPLPGYSDEDRKMIDLIDVVWFKGHSITHLFEVESSTAIVTGLLRMSDLLTLQPSLRPVLTIVAPKEREAEAKRVMHRPTFRFMGQGEGGREFEFKSFEDVRATFQLESRGGAIR